MNDPRDSLRGLPDFGAPLIGADGASCGFAPFGGGSFSILPQSLVVATGADGAPRLSLTLLKSLSDLEASGQYSVLDVEVVGDVPLETALAPARKLQVDATVAPLTLDSGFARLLLTNAEVAPPADLLAPVELGWSGAGYARWTLHLSSAAGDLIKGALAVGTVLLGARVEYRAAGVAPRTAATVQFTPAALVQALLSTHSDPQWDIPTLREALTQPTIKSLFSLSGGGAAMDVSEALADRVAAAFGRFVPATTPFDPPALQLVDPAALSSGSVLWDLSQPTLVFRYWALSMDSIGGLSAADLAHAVQEVTVPPMPLGSWNLAFTTNLPPHRTGVPDIGVTVELNPNPPFRPNSINHRLSFREPEDRVTCALQLSPRESLQYSVTPYAVIDSGAAVHTYTGAPQSHTETWVTVQLGDLPVGFAHFAATQRLLALAALTLDLTYDLPSGHVQQHFSVPNDTGSLALPIPKIASGTTVMVTAQPLGAGGSLQAGPFSEGSTSLDLTTFPGFGPHRVTILLAADPIAPLALQLLPETQCSNPSAVPSLVFFSAGVLSAEWGYVAASPFAPGFCYRLAAAAVDDPQQPWSSPQSPFSPLALHADGTPYAINAIQPAGANLFVGAA